MIGEPAAADPADVARKMAAAPTLKLPPEPEWEVGEDGRVTHYKMQSMGVRRKARNRIGELLFNMFTDQPGYSASDFVNGIFPENLVEEVEKLQKKLETTKD